MKIISITFLLALSLSPLSGKISPPNYNFSLDSLQIFYPGNSLENILQKQEGILHRTDLRRFHISHQRYRFPLFLQFKENRSVGFWAPLPTYFLHDVFHQSLINRYGKQDQYFKKENSAVFIWNNKKGLKIVYSAQCTLTCFPNYLLVIDPRSSTLLEDFSSLAVQAAPPPEQDRGVAPGR